MRKRLRYTTMCFTFKYGSMLKTYTLLSAMRCFGNKMNLMMSTRRYFRRRQGHHQIPFMLVNADKRMKFTMEDKFASCIAVGFDLICYDNASML